MTASILQAPKSPTAIGRTTHSVRTSPSAPPVTHPNPAITAAPDAIEPGPPRSRSYHPLHHADHRSPLVSPNCTKSPTAGTPSVIREREPNTTNSATSPQATAAIRAVPVRITRPEVPTRPAESPAADLAPHEGVDTHAPGLLQRPDVGIASPDDAAKARPPPADLAEAPQVPRPGCQHVADLAEPGGQQRDPRLAERQQRGQRKRHEERRPTRGDGHGAQLMAGPGATDVVDAGAFLESFAMPHAGVGDHHHPGAGELRPPAEVHVLASVRHPGIEALQGAEQPSPDHEAGGRNGEHVTDRVVLLLVEFAGLHDVGRHREPVDGVGDMLEAVGAVPVDELGTGDPAVRPERLHDHEPDGIAGKCDVVVAEEEIGRIDLGVEDRVGGRREAVGVAGIEHRRVGKRSVHPGTEIRIAGRVDHDHLEPGVILGREALEGLLEPLAGLVGHHDGQHRGCGVPRRDSGTVGRRRRCLGRAADGNGRVVVEVGHDRSRLPPDIGTEGYTRSG